MSDADKYEAGARLERERILKIALEPSEEMIERAVKAAAETDTILELKWPDDWSEAERHIWRQKIRAAWCAFAEEIRR